MNSREEKRRRGEKIHLSGGRAGPSISAALRGGGRRRREEGRREEGGGRKPPESDPH